MKSNEDYLDELLRSMGEEVTEEPPLTGFGLQDESKTPALDMGMGKMDQAMIDALLSGAGVSEEPEAEEEVAEVEEVKEPEAPALDMGMGKMDQAMIDALLSGAGVSEEPEAEEEVTEVDTEKEDDDFEVELRDPLVAYEDLEEEELGAESVLPDMSIIEESVLPDLSVIEDSFADMMEETKAEELADDGEASDMLAQLLAEVQEEAQKSELGSLDDAELMDEESIDALLSAAKESSGSLYEEPSISFDMLEDGDLAELDTLYGMSEEEEILDDDSALLRMLEEADAVESSLAHDEKDATQVDESEIEAILSNGDSSIASDNEDTSEGGKKRKKKTKKTKEEKENKENKEKKPSALKLILDKIISLLMEEIPDEGASEEDELNLSEENKNILDELNKEENKKIKVKEKKKEKAKKEKAKKEKPKKEKEPKKEKPKKAKKEKPAKDAGPSVPERKVPRKKIIVTFIFAFSVLALILLVEMLLPPMIMQSGARSAYDKGDYYEAYKGYYGQKLSEEDEKCFQGAKTIVRMQSNLDGYNNYLMMNKEVYALHSLLEGVKVKFDVFSKAEEYNVLSQVGAVYQQILDILSSKYQLSEEDALELIEEKSDAVYTRKLESIVEGKPYSSDSDKEMNQEDMLPEEEAIFHN